MEFSVRAKQRELKDTAVAFAREKLNQDLRSTRSQASSLEAWQACARFGIQGLPVPAELDGSSDIRTTVLVMGAVGYGCRDNVRADPAIR